MNKLLERLRLSETARIMCTAVAGLFAGLLALGLLIIFLIYPFERPFPYAMGLLLGCGLSAVKVVLMERSLEKTVEMDGKTAKTTGSLHSLARYLLTIAVLLAVVFCKGFFGLVGTIAGVLTLQIAAYITGHVLKVRERRAGQS